MAWSKLSIFFLLLIVILAGCVDTSIPKVGIPDVKVSEPYSINPNLIGLKTDINISIPIKNIRTDRINLEILEAKMVVNLKNNSKEYVYGYSVPISLGPNEATNLTISFTKVPIIFELKENPLRLSPVTVSYDINVRFSGTIKIFGIIPYTKTDSYSKTISIDEISIDQKIFTQILKSL